METIVERLRFADKKLSNWCETILNVPRSDVSQSQLMSEAADEIERLTGILDCVRDTDRMHAEQDYERQRKSAAE